MYWRQLASTASWASRATEAWKNEKLQTRHGIGSTTRDVIVKLPARNALRASDSESLLTPSPVLVNVWPIATHDESPLCFPWRRNIPTPSLTSSSERTTDHRHAVFFGLICTRSRPDVSDMYISCYHQEMQPPLSIQMLSRMDCQCSAWACATTTTRLHLRILYRPGQFF